MRIVTHHPNQWDRHKSFKELTEYEVMGKTHPLWYIVQWWDDNPNPIICRSNNGLVGDNKVFTLPAWLEFG